MVFSLQKIFLDDITVLGFYKFAFSQKFLFCTEDQTLGGSMHNYLLRDFKLLSQ